MKIYVSDDIYEYLVIGKRDIHSGVDDDLVVKSLEQHDRELLIEFAEDLNDWAREVALRHLGSGGSIHYNILYDKLNMLLKERGVE